MRRMLVVVVVAFVAAPSAAHDDAATLGRLDTAIARGDRPAERLLLRAEIERAERRWAAAKADLERAAPLMPGSAALARCRAALALDCGRPLEALQALRSCRDAELARDPRVPWIEAGALERLARYDEAARVMDAALRRNEGSSAEHYAARARVAEHRPEEGARGAIVHLEAGLARWPGAWNLLSPLLDLDVALERYDDALARLDAVIPRVQQPERLLARRGDVLALAGREWEARDAWTAALDGLEARPLLDAADREVADRLHHLLAATPPRWGAR